MRSSRQQAAHSEEDQHLGRGGATGLAHHREAPRGRMGKGWCKTKVPSSFHQRRSEAAIRSLRSRIPLI